MSLPSRSDMESEVVMPWDSDHTALVYVIWAARDKGLISNGVDADRLASHIIGSKWMTAVRQHAKERA